MTTNLEYALAFMKAGEDIFKKGKDAKPYSYAKVVTGISLLHVALVFLELDRKEYKA